MAAYKVGIIGSTGRGNYGHGLDTVWKGIPKCQVVAVADDNAEGLKEAIPRTGAERGYSDYREMLKKERPDIVAISPRWIDRHHEMAMTCAEYSCHMYMEKPFCRNLREADEIIRACEMRHLKLAVAHISRYSPQLGIVQSLIQAGEIGDLLEIRARGKEDARGGGEDLWVLGSHVLDLMRAFAGQPRSCFARLTDDDNPVTRASVRQGNEGLGPLAGSRVDAMFGFDKGVVGYFSSQRNAGSTPSRFGLRILGSKGMIDITSGYGNPAFLLNDPGWSAPNSVAKWKVISSNGVEQPETLTVTDYEGGNPAAVNDLIEAIEQDRSPRCSTTEARGTIEMIMAVFDSHRLKSPVSLPLQTLENPLGLLE
jgi:predicted dehydrogenase